MFVMGKRYGWAATQTTSLTPIWALLKDTHTVQNDRKFAPIQGKNT
jgi:hypothetical protein